MSSLVDQGWFLKLFGMGVSGLESFVETHPGRKACYPVNLATLAQSLPPEDPRVIVVDLSCCLRYFYHEWGGLDLVCGGQHREYRDHVLKVLVEKFEALSITPVFVRDGVALRSKRDTWVRRIEDTTKLFGEPVFQALRQGKYPQIRDKISLPKLHTDLVLRHDFGCEVVISSERFEADAEVVRLAKERGAFAILAQDSDYLLYDLPDSVTYLSLKHFNLSTFETKAYCRQALARYLRISKDQLPLLAVMKGNDIISAETLQPFHNRLLDDNPFDRSQSRSHKLIHLMAGLIDRLQLPKSKEDILASVPDIVDQIFREYSSSHLDQAAESVIRDYFLEGSAASESTDTFPTLSDAHWNEVLARCASVPGPLSDLLRYQVLESSFKLEDCRSSDLLPAPVAKILQPIRQRFYGFLLYEMPGALDAARAKFVATVDEWCYAGPGSLSQVTKQSIAMIPSHINHPGLLKLRSPDFPVLEKWKIFSHIFSAKIDPVELAEMEPENLLVALQLHIMQNVGDSGPILFDWEVQAFILTALVLRTKSSDQLSAIQVKLPPNVPDPRAVQLATVFGNNELIQHVSAMLGTLIEVQHLLAGVCFDGKLFQTNYLDMKRGRNELMESLTSKDKSIFDAVFKFATNGGQSLKV